MMSTVPSFSVTRGQAIRLQAYIQTYRHYAFSSILPSAERNTMLRVLQSIQAKLLEIIDKKAVSLQLLLENEEMHTLKAVISDMLLYYAKQPGSPKQVACVGDLSTFKNSLKEY